MLNISDFALFSCFLGAQLDLSAEDNVVALALAECLARPYAELIISNIPSPSNLRSARSTASRPLPPSTMGVSPIRLTAATPTRGEILVQLGALSRKPRREKIKLHGERSAGFGQGSEIGSVSDFSCSKAGAGTVACSRGSCGHELSAPF